MKRPWLFKRLAGRKVGRVCALDFDGRRLRLALADVAAGRARIERLTTVDMPDDLDDTDAAAVGVFLGGAMGRLGLAGVPVLMSVPRAKAIFRPLVLPPTADDSELANMVRFQAQKELSFRPEEAVIDFTLEAHYGLEPAPDETPGGQHVLAAAVQKPVVDYYRQVAEAAGVRLLRLGLRPYANMRCAEAYAGADQGRLAIVHLTVGEAEVDVIEQGGLTFSRAADLALPAADADAANRTAVVMGVVQEVARSLQSYLAVERDRSIDRVLVAGGTGIEAELAKMLGPRLGAPCEVFDPSGALRLREAPADASAFISALGLAVGQGDADAPQFDFLNPKQPVVRRNVARMAALAAGGAVVLVVVSAFAGAAIHLYRAGAQVEAQEKILNELRKDNKKVQALAKRVGAIEAWLNEGRNWLDQWAYLSATFPSCRDVYVTSLKAAGEGSVSLAVKARNNGAIDDLGLRLAKAGYGFKPGQVTTASDPYGYDYATSVQVLVEADMALALADLASVPRPDDDVSAERFDGGSGDRSSSGRPSSERPSGEGSSPERSSSEKPSGEKSSGEKPSGEKSSSERSSSERPSESRGDVDPYEAWRDKLRELYKHRPDRGKEPKKYEEWQRQVDELTKQRPSTGSGSQSEQNTRHPAARR